MLSAAVGGAYSSITQDGAARTFDEAGHPTGIANSAGAGLRVAYTSSVRIASVTDAEGRTVTLSTDNAGRLMQGALADGSRVTGLRRWDAGRAEKTRAHWRHRTSGQPSSPPTTRSAMTCGRCATRTGRSSTTRTVGRTDRSPGWTGAEGWVPDQKAAVALSAGTRRGIRRT